jgi:hypothetical protein
MAADVLYTEGRRGIQRLVDLEIPIIAAVNGPATVHSEYALLADIVIASETTVFADVPHPAFAIAPGDGLFVVWEEVLGLNRARYLEITQGSIPGSPQLGSGRKSGAAGPGTPPRAGTRRADDPAPTPDQQVRRRGLPPAHQPPTGRSMLTGMALESLTAANLAYLRGRQVASSARKSCTDPWARLEAGLQPQPSSQEHQPGRRPWGIQGSGQAAFGGPATYPSSGGDW